jgi:diguanylate cyclase (GGDEF)-like protein
MMNAPAMADIASSDRQLDRYAEDFGALFSEYREIKAQFDRALSRNRRAEEKLVNHDALTGLPNRTLCKDRLQQAISHARRGNGSVGLLFVDLDRFKEINDTLGHAVGDLLLIEFSWRLVHVIRDSDTAARLGGDEFVVIAPSLAHEENIRVIVDKIIHSLAEPFIIEGRELYVGASVGVAINPLHGADPDELLRQADTAMYAAKSAGGNTYRLFDDDLGQTQQQRLDMESGLRRALAQDQLRLAYQPQVRSTDGRIVGVEALLRWDWPNHGTVPPDRFISIAEETGLIKSIGAWVLRTACLQYAAWRRDGLTPLRMAVNISARQINDPAFVQFVAAVIAETGMQPGELELEITESQLMEQLHAGIENLERLRAMGVLVAVDDFGTGYSSLGRIRTLPIDRIKVDRSFIIDVDYNADSYAIANAILGMASALKLETIAEGIERADQAQLLAGICCHEFQGFLFGKPQPPEAIAALLRQQGEQP